MAGEELRAEKLLASDPEAALGVLIEAWRESFDPALGRLIEQLGASLAQPLEGLPIKKGERAAALTKLITTISHAQRSALLTSFEEFAREASGALVWPSIDAWADAKRDPRVARMALRVLNKRQYDLTAKLWRRLITCIEVHGDLGVVEETRPYEKLLETKGSRWGFSLERVSNVLKKLTKARQCKQPADPRVLEAMAARIGVRPVAPKPEDASAMLAEIGERPDDDGPRLVYADWLIERKQPWGELIVLQIARSKSKVSVEARAREADLLVTHKTALLGPFEGVVQKSEVKFERGFVAVASALKKLPAHPFTRLLRRVNFGSQGFNPDARFDSLEEAVGPEWPLRDQLPSRAPRLRSWAVNAVERPALLASIAKVPIEELSLRGLAGVSLAKFLPELYASAPRLSALELSLDNSVAPRPVLTPSLRSITFHIGQLDATLTRQESGWEAKLSIGYYAHPPSVLKEVTELLSPFPAQGEVSVKLTLPQRESARFEAAVQVVRKVATNVTMTLAR